MKSTRRVPIWQLALAATVLVSAAQHASAQETKIVLGMSGWTGFAPLTLTQEGQASPLVALGNVPVLHWHGDQFDIPPGALRLAGTDVCPNQAFSVGRHVLGLQCHLEADPRQIERWLVGHACELAQAGIDPRALRTQACALQTRLPQAAQAAFSRWLDGVGSEPPCSQP